SGAGVRRDIERTMRARAGDVVTGFGRHGREAERVARAHRNRNAEGEVVRRARGRQDARGQGRAGDGRRARDDVVDRVDGDAGDRHEVQADRAGVAFDTAGAPSRRGADDVARATLN